ncbi:iron ABC transporter permease [Paenibacillus sp. chi10]|uniref:Iron ABC transporter permease n=1 Tax=Paenibacillus suaedae TaxID=3077233 RepID=A0AAJ2JYD5_9BACL|nr:iron ABC transporter permease [Paenibacillus sp. chi10]MDT8978617.1 iron ABC transporter permease [Paenibacillus sp. chi10]
MVNSNQRTIPFIGKLIVGILLCAGMFVVAMVFGAADTSLRDVWLSLTSNATSDNISVLRDIRLPREIGAMVVGAALAVAGAIMQGMTRNPLADPGLLGLTAGANAALAITLALIPGANYYAITIACFIGAAVGAFIVFGIGAMKRGGFSPLRIVLAGAAVTAFLIAVAEGTGLYFKLSREISLWTAGGLIGTNWSQLQIIVPVVLVGILIAIGFSRQLTILSLNEEVAVGLGQKTLMVKIILFIVIVLLAGASVALVGNMAFIGLMIPHIVRAMVGTDYRFILPMSIFTGATFMLLADTLGRTINSPYETPVAAIVAMLGLPFFLFIVHKGGKAFS